MRRWPSIAFVVAMLLTSCDAVPPQICLDACGDAVAGDDVGDGLRGGDRRGGDRRGGDRRGGDGAGVGDPVAGDVIAGDPTGDEEAGGDNAASGDAGPEDCLDGRDNDGDGAVDCADSECTPFVECVPALPAAFADYVRIRSGAFGGLTVIECPDGGAPQRRFAEPRELDCTLCSCSGPDATCGPTPLLCDLAPPTEGDCSNSTDLTALVDGLGCAPQPAPGDTTMSCLVGDASPTSVGSCTESGGEPITTDLWAAEVDVCGAAPVGAGCAPSEACVPVAEPDYGDVCVQAAGPAICPADFPVENVVHESGIDARGCETCVCTSSPITCSGGAYQLFDNDDCTGADVVLSDNTCTWVGRLSDPGMGTWSVAPYTPAMAVGNCVASGGAPNGSVTTAGDATVCCR